MNKKIATEIAIGVIFLVVILLGLSIWLVNNDAKKAKIPEVINLENNNKKFQKAVLIKNDGETNYVIYVDEYGKENIIDQAPSNWENLINNGYTFDKYSIFSEATFSPKVNYILYKKSVYEEGEFVFIYDIANKIVLDNIKGDGLSFSPDENYFCVYEYGISYSIYNYPVAKIYKTSNLEEVYDLFGKIGKDSSQDGSRETEFYNGFRPKSCDYNNEKKGFNFGLEKYRGEDNLKRDSVFFKVESS